MAQVGNIHIQPEELKTLANKIKDQRRGLDSYFVAVDQEIKGLKNQGWDSQSGDALRERFEKLRRFYEQKYPPAMEDYIQFLERSSEDYAKQERDRMAEVNNLSNMGQ